MIVSSIKKKAKYLLFSLILLFGNNITFAQGGQGRPQGPPPIPNDEQIGKMVSDLSQELSLTEVQEGQVSEIYFAHFAEMSVLQNDNKNSNSNREVMDKIQETFQSEVKSVLTSDQQKKYKSYLKNNKPQGGGQGRPNN